MPIQTVLSVTPITEHYREAQIEDRYFRRIDQELRGPFYSATEQTDEALIALAQDAGLVRSEYSFSRAFEAEVPQYFAQILGWNREPEETIDVVTVKAPLSALPENFDSLTEAEQHAALIEYGRNITRTVNFADY